MSGVGLGFNLGYAAVVEGGEDYEEVRGCMGCSLLVSGAII